MERDEDEQVLAGVKCPYKILQQILLCLAFSPGFLCLFLALLV
jgi:hypothetical protein